MKKILAFIFSKKKTILLVILFFFFISFSFANDTIQTSAGGEGSISGLLMSLVDLLGSIWLIFPILAGKLLTNDFVYGSMIGLDSTLWNIWNFSRTIANYMIGFLFIYMIFRYLLFFSDKDASLIKTGLPKIVISSILVNMSWFLIAVLIDLSTIFIAVFGALPSNVGVNTPMLVFPKNMEVTVQKCDPSKNSACKKGTLQTDVKEKNGVNLKDLQTYETSISGPLMFLGMSIIEIPTTKNKLLEAAYDQQAQQFKHDGEAIKAIIKILIFLLFLIPIIILVVVNMVRIFWLRMYIAFSPLLFLDWIWGKNKLAGANKAFAFKNVIGLIFSPALVVLGFSISIIFILGVSDALNIADGPNTYTEQVKKKLLLDNSDGSILEIDFGEAQDTGKTGSKYVGGFIGYLITTFLIVILVWGIMKLSFRASEVTSGISDSMFKFSEDLFKTIPVPTPLGKMSIGSMQKLGQTIEAIPSNLVSKQSQELDRLFDRESDITPKVKKEILDGLKTSNTFDSSLDKLLNEILRFKGKQEAESSANLKALIGELEKAINHQSTVGLSNLASQLKTRTTYREKIDLISKHSADIKKFLKHGSF